MGSRVRALRESLDLSLRDLAERSGVSAPMLSQVERGETSPTLTVANRIAAGLDLRLSQLLRLDESGTVSVVRPGERRSGGADGHRWEVLTPPLPGQRAEVSCHTVQPARARAALATRRCTSPARERPRSSSTGACRSSATARAMSSPRGTA